MIFYEPAAHLYTLPAFLEYTITIEYDKYSFSRQILSPISSFIHDARRPAVKVSRINHILYWSRCSTVFTIPYLSLGKWVPLSFSVCTLPCCTATGYFLAILSATLSSVKPSFSRIRPFCFSFVFAFYRRWACERVTRDIMELPTLLYPPFIDWKPMRLRNGYYNCTLPWVSSNFRPLANIITTRARAHTHNSKRIERESDQEREREWTVNIFFLCIWMKRDCPVNFFLLYARYLEHMAAFFYD